MKSTYPLVKKIGFILGPILFLVLFFMEAELISKEADPVVAVAVWMVVWWITEAVSISVTALIPLTFFPLLGIMDIKTVAANYGSPIVFLFFGGFVMALALEKVNLHRRIALLIIRATGSSPNRVILGFMLATAFLSMWISNTATTVVMLPIALSVIQLLINDEDGFTAKDKNFALSIMLGIAYSANVGGIATIIGTPPNSVLVGFLENEYDMEVSFGQWMMMGVPFSLLMLGIVYTVLVRWIYPNHLPRIQNANQVIQNELKKLGPLNPTEMKVLLIFFITIMLWMSRRWINDSWDAIELTDAGISMLAAFSLFAIPFEFNKGKFALEWEDTKKLPWGILILFGGGLALAGGLSQAGVIDVIGNAIAENSVLTVTIVTILLITVMLFMTELMSNVALVAVFAPVVAGIAIGLDAEMLHVLIPVTLAASCAFMLPMATPPNAIVFASGYVKVHEMAKAGIFLNIIAILLLIVFVQFVIPVVF